MLTRCPRCQLDFDAAAPWVQCPRCGAPFSAVSVPPTHQQPQYVPSTQAVDPALLARVQRASAPSQPAPPAPAYQAPYAPAPQTAYAPAYREAPRGGFVPDEDLAGRAVISTVVSVVALLGGCNPVGLAGVTWGLLAYSAANDQRVDLARTRGRTARRLAWASFLITLVVWTVVVLSLFYEF
jgi:hypothetical protein